MCIGVRFAVFGVLTFLLLQTTVLARESAARASRDEPNSLTRERFKALVRKLDSESFNEREAASESLVAYGPRVLEWIVQQELSGLGFEAQARLTEIRWIVECLVIHNVDDATRAYQRCVEAEATRWRQPKHARLLKLTSSREAQRAFDRLCPEAERVIRTADLFFSSGMAWLRRDGADGLRKSVHSRAGGDLGRAVELYGEWLERYPNDKEAKRKQTVALMILYAKPGKTVNLDHL